MNRITFPLSLLFSGSFYSSKIVFDAEADGRVGVVSRSCGRKSAGFCTVSGCGVPLFLDQMFPVIHKS